MKTDTRRSFVKKSLATTFLASQPSMLGGLVRATGEKQGREGSGAEVPEPVVGTGDDTTMDDTTSGYYFSIMDAVATEEFANPHAYDFDDYRDYNYITNLPFYELITEGENSEEIGLVSYDTEAKKIKLKGQSPGTVDGTPYNLTLSIQANPDEGLSLAPIVSKLTGRGLMATKKAKVIAAIPDAKTDATADIIFKMKADSLTLINGDTTLSGSLKLQFKTAFENIFDGLSGYLEGAVETGVSTTAANIAGSDNQSLKSDLTAAISLTWSNETDTWHVSASGNAISKSLTLGATYTPPPDILTHDTDLIWSFNASVTIGATARGMEKSGNIGLGIKF